MSNRKEKSHNRVRIEVTHEGSQNTVRYESGSDSTGRGVTDDSRVRKCVIAIHRIVT